MEVDMMATVVDMVVTETTEVVMADMTTQDTEAMVDTVMDMAGMDSLMILATVHPLQEVAGEKQGTGAASSVEVVGVNATRPTRPSPHLLSTLPHCHFVCLVKVRVDDTALIRKATLDHSILFSDVV
uniref:Uncharacterized protein n=1 Tax=Graphocephala atropunctata TaxID=36148 RepID=A0A1B6KJV5_9HEMI